MGIIELLTLLSEQHKKGFGYAIHVNSGDSNNEKMGVELSDLYFTDCTLLKNTDLLVFDNRTDKPISHKEDGTPLYSFHSNTELYLDISQIEKVTDVQDTLDWFNFAVSRVIDIKLKTNNSVTIGFIE